MSWFRKAVCRHEFHFDDMHLTGIEAPPKPDHNSTFSAAMEYFMTIHKHPSHTERVEWACCKCGKSFPAHSGLEILRHGKRVITRPTRTP